jgi:hypothetical protein
MSVILLLPVLAAASGSANPPVITPVPVVATARVLRLIAIGEGTSDKAPSGKAPPDVRIKRSVRACGAGDDRVPQTCTLIVYEVE